MARIPYIFVRKGGPSEITQREALADAGLTPAELWEAWADVIERKLRPGQPVRPERALMLGALREGDEVWVARPALLAEDHNEALAFLADLAEDKANLHIVSTGRTYHSGCPHALVRLAADVAKDLSAMQTENARKAPRQPRIRVENLDTPQWRMAKERWHDAAHTAAGIEKSTGIKVRTLYRYLGERGTPYFGRIPQKRRRTRK
jgi:DNA invertase Pin-like site-specific DNA recombinase